MDIEKNPCCEEKKVHEEAVENSRENMPHDETLYQLADIFKIFGDSTRIKILFALFEGEMCVCDLVSLLGSTQSAVSHQLRILRANRLVKFRREGKSIFYSLDDDHVKSIIGEGFNHIMEGRVEHE